MKFAKRRVPGTLRTEFLVPSFLDRRERERERERVRASEWLVKKWGDVCPHETVNSHIHRLLDTYFACWRLQETVPEFMARVKKVEKFMNSKRFAWKGGRGLKELGASLRSRCKEVIDRKGERIPR